MAEPIQRRTGWAIWCDATKKFATQHLFQRRAAAQMALKLSARPCCRVVRVEQVTRAIQPKSRKKR